MTNPMTCEMFEERLMPYLEQETDDATRFAMDRHAVACVACGALLADLRKIRFDAANLPELQPSRDLWSGIAARIEAPIVPITPLRENAPVRRRQWTRVALIAASLVAAAGLGYLANGSRPATTVAGTTPVGDTALRVAVVPETVTRVDTVAPPATSAPATGNRVASRARTTELASDTRPAGTRAVQAAYATVSADYDREIARLRALIEQRRNQIDPVTVAIIEKNLQVIDTAIAQCRTAIARDPSSRFLLESLNQSLQSKVELMRTAALLPSRT